MMEEAPSRVEFAPTLREFEPLTQLLNKLPRKAQRGFSSMDVTYHSIDASKEYIAVGSSIGILFLYDRKKESLQRLNCEVRHVITSVRLVNSVDYMVAAGLSNGLVCVFQLPSSLPGRNKQLQKYNVSDVHTGAVSCLTWSANAQKLYSGDLDGTVVLTEIDYNKKECKSCSIANEGYEIVQLDYNHRTLVISTKLRTCIYRDEHLHQVGTKDRKCLGNFGAVFARHLCKAADAILYACRPGLRLWRANIDGHVMSTIMFRDLIAQHKQTILLLSSTVIVNDVTQQASSRGERHFGPLLNYHQDYLVTYDASAIYILDPVRNALIGQNECLGQILDVTCTEDEIFVVRSSGSRNIIRIGVRPEHPPVVAPDCLQLRASSLLTEYKGMMSPGLSTRRPSSGSASPIIISARSSPLTLLPASLLGKLNPDSAAAATTVPVPAPPPRPAPMDSAADAGYVPCDVAVPAADVTNIVTSSTALDKTNALPPIVKLENADAPQIKLGVAVEEKKAFVPFAEKYAMATNDQFEEILVFRGKAKKKDKDKNKKKKKAAKDADNISSRSLTPRLDEEPVIDGDAVVDSTVAAGDAHTPRLHDNDVPVDEITAADDAKTSAIEPESVSETRDGSQILDRAISASSELPPNDGDLTSTILGTITKSKPLMSLELKDEAPRMDEILSPECFIVGGRVVMTKPERKDSVDDVSQTLAEDIYTKYQERTIDFNSPLTNPMMTRMRRSCTSQVAEAWSEFLVQSELQSIAVSDKHIWIVDKNERVHYSTLDQPKLLWKQAPVLARQVSVSPDGAVVWLLARTGAVTVGLRVTARAPMGLGTQEVLDNVAYISVDNTMAWYITNDGEVMVQKGLSRDRPYNQSYPVSCDHDLVQVVCRCGLVYGVTSLGAILIRTGIDRYKPEGTGWMVIRSPIDGVAISCLSVSDESVTWAMNVAGDVYFATDVIDRLSQSQHGVTGDDLTDSVTSASIYDSSIEDAASKKISDEEHGDQSASALQIDWWQLSLSEYFIPDMTEKSAVRALRHMLQPLAQLSPLALPVAAAGGLLATGAGGIWLCSGSRNSLHVCHGTLTGHLWSSRAPIGLAASMRWACLSAQALDDSGAIWTQQPNGEVLCINAETNTFMAASIPGVQDSLRCLSVTEQSCWALTAAGDVYVRNGISKQCPWGSQWRPLDLTQLGDCRLEYVSCAEACVWAVDDGGCVWLRIGPLTVGEDQTIQPAWIQVDQSAAATANPAAPFFTQVVTGHDKLKVWALDNKQNVYARRCVTEALPLGSEWVHVPGAQAHQLTISRSTVWALYPNGKILARYGITDDDCLGNYWKRIPGRMKSISASANDHLWGVNDQDQLCVRSVRTFEPVRNLETEFSQSRVRTQSDVSDGDWELL